MGTAQSNRAHGWPSGCSWSEIVAAERNREAERVLTEASLDTLTRQVAEQAATAWCESVYGEHWPTRYWHALVKAIDALLLDHGLRETMRIVARDYRLANFELGDFS